MVIPNDVHSSKAYRFYGIKCSLDINDVKQTSGRVSLNKHELG
jgi:hypothetical protein